jgi:hypothetical protein
MWGPRGQMSKVLWGPGWSQLGQRRGLRIDRLWGAT